MSHLNKIAILALLCFVYTEIALAQQQASKDKEYQVNILVTDSGEGNAISGIVVSTTGNGPRSKPTDGTGRTILYLKGDIAPGEELDLVLPTDVEENKPWEIPLKYRPLIHAFNGKPSTHTSLPLIRRRTNLVSPINSEEWKSATLRIREQAEEILALHMQIGFSYYNQLQYEKAVEEFNIVLQKDAFNSKALYYISLALYQQGKYQESLLFIEKCLDLRVTDSVSKDVLTRREHYVIVLVKLNKMVEASRQKEIISSIKEALRLQGSQQ